MVEVLLLKDDDDSRYSSCLKTYGKAVTVIPPLTFKFINKSGIELCLKNPDNYSGLIFTSQRAAECVSEIYLKLPASVHMNWKNKSIFSLGYATNDFVESKLDLSSSSKNARNATELGSVIVKSMEAMSKPLLYPCGNLRRDELPQILASNDINFNTVTCYETQQSPNLETQLADYLASSNPDYIVFFSPSAVNYVVPVLKKINFSYLGTNCVAIGATTNSALVKCGIAVSAIANEPTPEGVASVVR